MIKTFRKILTSIQTVDDYLVEKKARGEAQDKRITELFRATMNGESDWFLEWVRRDPDCALKIIEECNGTDESHK
jgi:hypothetical protein